VKNIQKDPAPGGASMVYKNQNTEQIIHTFTFSSEVPKFDHRDKEMVKYINRSRVVVKINYTNSNKSSNGGTGEITLYYSIKK
jgi:hypothetical protein